jgi:hypothetical protein
MYGGLYAEVRLGTRRVEETNKENVNPNPGVRLVTGNNEVEEEGKKRPAVDPQKVSVYAREISDYLWEREAGPIGDWTEVQEGLTAGMRELLIDWMADLSVHFSLTSETLFISVNCLDRFLMKETLDRSKLQLLGMASIFVASKYEEVHPPTIDKILATAGEAYTTKDLLDMEGRLLEVLNFQLTYPTILRFLFRYAGLLSVNTKTLMFSRFLAELSLTSSKLNKFRNSTIAAGAIYLSNKIVRRVEDWPISIIRESRLSLSEVRVCAKELYVLLISTGTYPGSEGPLNAIRRKFSAEKYLRVSLVCIEHRF